MPPIYTAHTSTGNELMVTNLSLFQLYKSVVDYADRNDFNKLLSVYHLDKLFMEMKNVAHEIRHSNKIDKALPSVALATDNLTKDVIYTVQSIGCSYHDNLGYAHVCSNYYVCKWIYIISTHCCQYFDIKFISGCHFNFNLSITEIPFKKMFDDLKISEYDYFPNDTAEKKSQHLTTEGFPRLKGKEPTIDQQSMWNESEQKVKMPSKTICIENNDFPPLVNSQKVTQESYSMAVGTNSWHSKVNRGRGIVSKVQNNNTSQLNEKIKSSKGRGFNSN